MIPTLKAWEVSGETSNTSVSPPEALNFRFLYSFVLFCFFSWGGCRVEPETLNLT